MGPLTLVALTDASLEREAKGLPPDLPGVTVAGWPPEHWEPHVIPSIKVQYIKHPQTRGWHRYVVLNATADEPPRLIGTLGASPKKAGEVEFGYSILSAFQRRGYGTMAACAFADWLASQADVSLLSAQTYPELEASIRVMQSCGLTSAGAGDTERTVRYTRDVSGRA